KRDQAPIGDRPATAGSLGRRGDEKRHDGVEESPLDEAKRAGLQALDVLQEVAVAEEKGANGRAGPPKKPRSALGHRAIISDRAVRTGAERVDRGRRGPIIGECGALSSLPS